MTRARMLLDAQELIIEAEAMRDRVMKVDPSRVYLARAVVDDTVRAYVEMESASRITAKVRTRAFAYLQRAKLLTDALNAPIQ